MTLVIALIIIGAITLYVACGVLAYGLTLAYFQQHFYSVRRRMSDRYIALLIAACGPIGVGLELLLGERAYHGLQWRATDSVWAAGGTIDPVAYDAYHAAGHVRKHRDSTL